MTAPSPTARTLRLGLLAFLLLIGAGSVRAQAVLGPGLSSTLSQTDPAERIAVVVSFHGNAALSADQTSRLASLGVDGLLLESLPITGLMATPAQIQTMASWSDVRSIWPNQELTFYNEDARDLTGVNKARTDAGMRNAMGLPFSGKGIAVVVNDSGIDGAHPDVEYGNNVVQNVQAAFNLQAVSGLAPRTVAEDQINTDTGSGHGTHVAGTVGGTGEQSGGTHAGVAPGADLIGYGSGTAALLILDGIGGFDYAVTNQFRYGIRVITNSWGSSGTFDPNHPINIASYIAYQRGITVLFAAGNSGPNENTHNPYAVAPWVISVGAGTKAGTLIDFSSRGVEGDTGTFTNPVDNTTWTFVNEPTIVAPGVDIISTRATTGALPLLAADVDADVLGADAAFYTHMSGTSMATPHVAGIVALMLEADPTLQPDAIKTIIRNTATNMPGRESWEVGAGYVNAYAALQHVLGQRAFDGSTLTATTEFNANVQVERDTTPFTIDFNPQPALSADGNTKTFNVPAGLSVLAATFDAEGLAGETGNPIYPVLIAPDGTEYLSGTTLLFTLEYARAQLVSNPAPGTWTLEIRGIQSGTGQNVASVPEVVDGQIIFETVLGISGASDIAGHPAEGAISAGIDERLVDSFPDGSFRPEADLTRGDLARFMVWGIGVRQGDGSATFGDVSASTAPFAEAVAMRGAALKDRRQVADGVVIANGSFNPNAVVSRSDLAYSLIQSLGLSDQAQAFDGQVTAAYFGTRVPVTDVSGEGAGYIQAAIDLGLMTVRFDLVQGRFDLEPTVTARFEPAASVKRGDYAVSAFRYLLQF